MSVPAQAINGKERWRGTLPSDLTQYLLNVQLVEGRNQKNGGLVPLGVNAPDRLAALTIRASHKKDTRPSIRYVKNPLGKEKGSMSGQKPVVVAMI